MMQEVKATVLIAIIFLGTFSPLGIDFLRKINNSDFKKSNMHSGSENTYSFSPSYYIDPLAFNSTSGFIIKFKDMNSLLKLKENFPGIYFKQILLGYVQNYSLEKLVKFINQDHVKIYGIFSNRHVKLCGRIVHRSDGLQDTPDFISIINVTPLWDLGFFGENIRVAIIDTGIGDHELLKGKIVENVSFIKTEYGYLSDDADTSDAIGHGTAVAGIIAGGIATENGSTFGIAPKAKLLNLKVFPDSESGATEIGIIAAIMWAVEMGNVDIINLSLGRPEIISDPLVTAVEWATQQGVVVVTAAGNSGEGGLGSMQIDSPGTSPSVITVGATDRLGNYIATYSSIGPALWMGIKPEVVAPGDVDAPVPKNVYVTGYARVQGTSFATPQVVGAAVLLVEVLKREYMINKENIPSIIKASIIKTSKPLFYGTDIISEIRQGSGLLNIGLAYYELINSQRTPEGLPKIIGILPRNIPCGLGFPFYEALFYNMSLEMNFTIISGYSTQLNVSLLGNFSNVVKLNSMKKFNIINGTNLWEFNITVLGAPEGFYQGKIVFYENETIISNVSIHFYLKKPSLRMLWDVKHTSWTMDHKYGQYRYFYSVAESMNVSVEQAYLGEKDFSYQYLQKYDIIFMPDTASYSYIYDENGSLINITTIYIKENEISSLVKYVDSGGFLFIIAMIPSLGEFGSNMSIVNKFSRRFGVEFGSVVLYDDVEPVNMLGNNELSVGVDKIPFYGTFLKVINKTSTEVIAKDSNGYSVLALYRSRNNGAILFSSTNYFLDNWAYTGHYETSFQEAQNVLRFARNLFLWRISMKYIQFSYTPNEPNIEDTVTFDVTMNSTLGNILSVTAIAKDLLGIRSIDLENSTPYHFSGEIKVRHGKLTFILLEVMQSKYVFRVSFPIYVPPAEDQAPVLLAINPLNNTKVEISALGELKFSIKLEVNDTSQILFDAIETFGFMNKVKILSLEVEITKYDAASGEINIAMSRVDLGLLAFKRENYKVDICVQIPDVYLNFLILRLNYTLVMNVPLWLIIGVIGLLTGIIVILVAVIAMRATKKKKKEEIEPLWFDYF